MLAGIILTIVTFFLVRFLASLAVTRAAVYNAAGAGAVVLFLAGMWAGSALFGGPAPAPVAVSQPTSVVVATPATEAPHAPLIRLSEAFGKPAIANIDALTADPNFGVAPPGNAYPLGAVVYARGWAASSAKTRLKRFVVVIDHRLAYDGTANYGNSRPDVARFYKAAAMTNTGFSAVAFPTAGLSKGPHVAQVGGTSNDPRHYRLSPAGVTFTVQ